MEWSILLCSGLYGILFLAALFANFWTQGRARIFLWCLVLTPSVVAGPYGAGVAPATLIMLEGFRIRETSLILVNGMLPPLIAFGMVELLRGAFRMIRSHWGGFGRGS